MTEAIDTSSLLSLARYYLPFDKNKILYNLMESKIQSKDLLVLDKVYNECEYTSKGLVIKSLPYLKSKKNQINTAGLLPTKKFFNQLENQFINGTVKNRLTKVEFEEEKNRFLNSADAKLLLYSLNNRKEGIVIVSEETEAQNDNKYFKKLPAICKMLNLKIKTLPEMLAEYDEIDFEFK